MVASAMAALVVSTSAARAADGAGEVVTETAPYMHDGSEETLAQVLEFYDRGGIASPALSKEIKPLKLSAQEKRDLVAFLESLTGEVRNAVPPETLPR